METLALLGTTLGLGLTAGINLYATVFVTGLGLRLGWLVPPAGLDGLDVLAHPAVLVAAGVLYAVEFLADKIPAVDHAWDLLHSFVRPQGAAVVAWVGVEGAQVAATPEVVIGLMAGGVALTSHVAKAGGRLFVGASGGHVVGAGVGLSLIEDVFAIGLAGLAVSHPLVMIGLVVAFLVFFMAFGPLFARLFAAQLRTAAYLWRHKLTQRSATGLSRADLSNTLCRLLEETGPLDQPGRLVVPARVTGLSGVPRWSSGVLDLGPAGLRFVSPGWFRTRRVELSWTEARPQLVERLQGLMLVLDTERGRAVVKFYPLTRAMADRVRAAVPAAETLPHGLQPV